MAIIQTIDNASQFRDQFHRAGRGGQFSYEALGLLFDYLDESGEDVELDVVAICCEFAEDTLESIANNYDIKGADADDLKDAVSEFLSFNTTVVGETSTGSFVYVQF
jgi:hypothetical protein